jgi:hypothetical protein
VWTAKIVKRWMRYERITAYLTPYGVLFPHIAYLPHAAESFLRSQPVFRYSINSPHYMEPEGSLQHSQVPTTCPYPKPHQSSPCPPFYFLKIHLNIILPSMPETSKRSLPSAFPSKTLYTHQLSPIRATRTAHLILLYLITQTLLGEEYRSSSLCSLLQSLLPRSS